MGVVYLARDPRLARDVALKTYLLPQGLRAEHRRELQERFLREARAAAALDHPAIVTVHDYGEDPADGTPYLAIEYVEGSTLAARLAEQGRMEPDRAKTLVEQLSEGLAAAHAAGVVHRDLKPANILIRTRDGAAKIADFGIARVASSDLTAPGSMLGSPAYMSPEQIRGGTVDARSDLFSLAVVFYEMLTGERPFRGEDTAQLAYAIVHETPVPVTRSAAGVPAGLDAFFERALAKDPARRFPDARTFREALEQAWRNTAPAGEATVVAQEASAGPFARPLAVAAEPARARGRRWPLVAGLAVLLAAAWGLVGGRPARLHLEGRSSVAEGTLVVRLDGDEIYRRELAAAPVNKAFGFLRKVAGRPEESFEAWLEVAPGSHEITAELRVPGRPEQRETIVVEVEPGRTHSLKIATGLAFRRPVVVKFQEDWE